MMTLVHFIQDGITADEVIIMWIYASYILKLIGENLFNQQKKTTMLLFNPKNDRYLDA